MAALTSLSFILPALLAGCDACGGQVELAAGEEEPAGEAAPTPAVEVVRAREGALPLRERLTGTVRATGQVAIYPQVSGPIVEVLAQNGERVERGDPLVQIRPQIPASQVDQARAGLEIVRADAERARANLEELAGRYRRTLTLAEDNLVSEETVETQRAQLNVARASYAQAPARVEQAEATVVERREALEQTVVRAPITGRVGQRNAEVGMQADAQTPLFTIGSLDRMRVEVPVTQEMLGWLQEGQRVEIGAENLPDTVIGADVSRISPFLAEGSFSAEAEIDVSNDGGLLLPGMFVTVDVFYGESERATLVPKSALYDDPGRGMGVYVAPSLGLEVQPAAPSGETGLGPLTAPTPTRFKSVEVVAEGRSWSGCRASRRANGSWSSGRICCRGRMAKRGPRPACAR